MGSVSSNMHETRASVSSAANGWVSNVICMGALSPPIVVHGLFDFPASFLGAFVLASVPRLLALRQGDFDLRDAVTKINPQRYDGQTLGFDSAGELVNFALVKEKLASAQRLVVPRAAR